MPQPVARRRTKPPTNSHMPTPIQSVAKGRSNKISMGIYGEVGIGKTVLIGTISELPVQNRVLLVRPPVDHTDSIPPANATKIDEWVVTSWAEMDDVMIYTRTDGSKSYDWVWLDSASLWFDQGIDDIWNQLIEDKPHRARWGLDRGEYWLNMQRLTRWTRHMVGCPFWHFGFTAHVSKEASSENEEDPQEKLMPYIQGRNMPSKMSAYTNILGYMHWDKVGNRQRRVLDLQSTADYYAKDQFNLTERGRLVDPTMPKLLAGLVKNTQPRTKRAVKRRP